MGISTEWPRICGAFLFAKGNAMKNLKIAYVDEKLVAIECDGLSCSSLPFSEFPIDSTALTLPQLMLEDAYAATS